MILYETKQLKIESNEDFGGLLITWRGFSRSDEFREGIEKTYEIILERNIHKTLTDISEHQGITPADQEYVIQRSLEFSQTYGELKRAIIIPKDVFAKFAMKNVNQKIIEADNQLRKTFDNIEDAIAWLKETSID